MTFNQLLCMVIYKDHIFMKNIILISLFGVILLAGCNSNKKEKAEALFTDPVMQDEIFNAILNDSARLHDFYDKVHMKQKGSGGMHQRMMKKMCCAPGMDSVMMCDKPMQRKMMRHMLQQTDQDSMFCMQMGDSVMRHDRLRKHLQRRMEPDQQKRKGR